MKLVKDPKTFTIKCSHCGAKMEITRIDIKHDGVSNYITCPACEGKVYVKKSTFGNRWSTDGWMN